MIFHISFSKQCINERFNSIYYNLADIENCINNAKKYS